MLKSFLGHFNELAYGAMRVVFSFVFVCHGLQKLFGLFGGHPVALTSLPGAAGLIEAFLGSLIGLGLFTSFAAFIASGEMAFAYFMVHAPRARWQIRNGGSLAAVLCFGFLYIATRGGGRWSLDSMRRGGGG
jgi:putative oxidoreductase